MGMVLGVGEMLWDIFPAEKHLGGAPVNFAYHCRQMGLDARPVSRIGKDALGEEILGILKAKGIPAGFVQIDEERLTGTVKVAMAGTSHTFTITEDVAWDYIEADDELLAAAREAEAICFGSLAQRSGKSRETILAMVKACGGLKVYDINLRQTFFSKEIIEGSLGVADVLKLNEDEIWVLGEMLGLGGEDMAAVSREILSRYGLKVVCVTRGENGALLVSENEVADEPGEKAEVVDTVGCGDAFCAAMVAGILKGKPLKTIAREANRVGLFVAGMAGGTPGWTEEMKREIHNEN
jgi:fructokinase